MKAKKKQKKKNEVKARYRLATFRHPVRRNLKRKSWTSALKSIAKNQSSRNPFNSLKILKSEDRSKDCNNEQNGYRACTVVERCTG